MWWDQVFFALGLTVVLCPVTLLTALGLTSLFSLPMGERNVARLTATMVSLGLSAALSTLILMVASGKRHIAIELGNWVVIPQEHFHFHLKFVFDRLSTPFVILSFVLCGTIGAFASRYLHRDLGYRRFFVLFAMFLLGMITSSLAGTIETLFFGWELVGLSSALLVAFFHDRYNPVRNGERVWIVYRIADAAFLVAALALHHLTGNGDFEVMMGSGPWPDGVAALSESHALFVGSLLLIAAAGKSALIPFSGWLPRAMEGPTPSSAVFYGALSVHLGAYLLLRVSPILEKSPILSAAVITVGALSAAFGALAARVQTDIKSALAFASVTQTGIIVVEIGLGFEYLALAHIIGHACLRTLQLLRAPTLLQDVHLLENAVGRRLADPQRSRLRSSNRATRWIYRFAIERGFTESLLTDYIATPFLRTFRWCDRMEKSWTCLLDGRKSQQNPSKRQPESLEDLI